LGYAQTFQNTVTLGQTNQNPSIIPGPITYITQMLPPPMPTERVLAADATISAPGQNNPNNKYSYNWTDIAGGYSKHHLSAHLEGSVPIGGNVLMLDGHVEWRKFAVILPRTTAGSAPVFWW
jgi:prepilin-type processing-associated H-X9-DG protein